MVHQSCSSLEMARHAGKMDGSATVGLHIEFRTALAEQSHGFRVAFLCSIVQWLMHFRGESIDLCLTVEQKVYHICTTSSGGPMQRSQSPEGVFFYECLAVEKQLDNVIAAGKAGVMDWVAAVRDLLAVYLCACLQQHHTDISRVDPGCFVQHAVTLRPEWRIDVHAALLKAEPQKCSNFVRITIIDGLLELCIHSRLLQDIFLFHGTLVPYQVLQLLRLRQLLLHIAHRHSTAAVVVIRPDGASGLRIVDVPLRMRFFGELVVVLRQKPSACSIGTGTVALWDLPQLSFKITTFHLFQSLSNH
mmetsp:Transcript_105850/g.194128  ORF Transcript_105850/g.194128 Transcript_105850/m.194128 type:complete len:304 (+) Transcript_105850:391-1302(+)